MKKLLLILLSFLFSLPAFAQDRDLVEARGQKMSELAVKVSGKITAECSQKIWECGQKIQELASQQKDFTEQMKICQELGEQVGICVQARMNEFSNDTDKLNAHDPNFDSVFSQLLQKWGM